MCQCYPYADGTSLCPSGSFECYSDTGIAPTRTRSVSHTSTPSLTGSLTQSPTVSPSFTASVTSSITWSSTCTQTVTVSPSNAPFCKRCSPGSWGRCQQANGICWDITLPFGTMSVSPSPTPSNGLSVEGSTAYVFLEGTCKCC